MERNFGGKFLPLEEMQKLDRPSAEGPRGRTWLAFPLSSTHNRAQEWEPSHNLWRDWGVKLIVLYRYSCWEMFCYRQYTGCFYYWQPPENVFRLAPPQFALTGTTLDFRSVGVTLTWPDTFLYRLLTSQRLTSSGECQLKKHPVKSGFLSVPLLKKVPDGEEILTIDNFLFTRFTMKSDTFSF